MNNNIDIIGPYPPPFGGVSIHISRIVPLLFEQGLTPNTYNQYFHEDKKLNILATNKSYKWWLTYIFKKKSPVVHFHQFSYLHFPYVLLLSWLSNTKYIITIHNEKILSYPQILQAMILTTLKLTRLSRLIVVSKTLYTKLDNNKIKNLIWLPAYVPPSNTKNLILPGLHSTKVAYNAAQLSDLNAIEAYGADHLFALAKDHPSIGFHIFIGEPSSKAFLESYLADKNINNCTIYYGDSMVDYLGSADIFLRLNREDAYGISIDEALDLNVLAIASDVCVRAKGCITYKKGDYQDLSKSFTSAMTGQTRKILESREKSKYHLQLISIYKELLTEYNTK